MTKTFKFNKKSLIIFLFCLFFVVSLVIANFISLTLLKTNSTAEVVSSNEFEIHMLSLSKSKVENEAKTIVSNMPQSIANGLLYIADADFVEECELDGIYENIIDDITLKNLLKNSVPDVCEIYKNASEEQKKIIIEMIVDKKINNVPVDANILVELGKLCGKDLINIEPLDEE